MLSLHDIYWSTPDGVPILKGLSLDVPDGALTVVTGPNGGGKTTSAKVIAGIVAPTSGTIMLDGEDVTDLDVTGRARKGISYSFQIPVRFKGIRVRDLIGLGAGHELSEEELCSTLSKVGLCPKDYKDREVDATLSGGEAKRIEIASVLARHSRISIFDEPEAGIDLWSFNGLIEAFEEMKKEGGTQVIISHQERMFQIADHIIVVEDGRVAREGTREEVLPTLFSFRHCPKDASGEVRL